MPCARLSKTPRIVCSGMEVYLWPFLSFGTRWEWVLRRTLPPLYPWESTPRAEWTEKFVGPRVGLCTATKRILCSSKIEPRTSFQPVRSLVTTAVNLSDSQHFDRILTLIATFFSALGYFLWVVPNLKFTDFIYLVNSNRSFPRSYDGMF